MPRVTFLRDFDWYPSAFRGRVVVAFRGGSTRLVTRACAAAAAAAGAIVPPAARQERTDGQNPNP